MVVAGTAEKFELMKKPVSDRLGVSVQLVTVPENIDSIADEDYNEFFCTIGGLIRED